MIIPKPPLVRATIYLGTTEDGFLCVRDPNNAWLLNCGKPGKQKALAISYTEQIPAGAELQFVAKTPVTIYDDAGIVGTLGGNRSEFYITADSEIIIRIGPRDSWPLDHYSIAIDIFQFKKEEDLE